MQEKLYVTCFQVRYNSLIMWDQWQGPATRRKLEEDIIHISKQGYQGDMTAASKKRLKKRLDVLLQLSPRHYETNPATMKRMMFQLAFVTLTMSADEIIDHKTAHSKCLTKFTRWLNTLGITYIWKAELQKSGQIHYHVIINKPIHYRDIRDKWNRFQDEAGYLIKYEEQNGHKDANSTDVHAVAHVKDLHQYISKYISKSNKCFIDDYENCDPSGIPSKKEVKINGKVWDCSQALKAIKMYQAEDDQDVWNEAGKYGEQKTLDQCGIVLNVNPESYLSKYHKAAYNKWKIENKQNLIK